MTPEQRLWGSIQKVRRAKQNVRDFDRVTKEFFDSKPYAIETEDHPETGEYFKRLMRLSPIDPQISAVFGDILFNLRSALDYLACQLALLGLPNGTTLNDKALKSVYFPIGDDAANYIARCKTQVVPLRPDAKKLIDEIEPYRGGKGELLWTIRALNDADKHRLLVTAATAVGQMRVQTGHILATAKAMKFPLQMAVIMAQQGGPIIEFHVDRDERISKFPLETGDILFASRLENKPYERVHFILQIALNEPGIIQGKPIVETAKDLVDFVDTLLPLFIDVLS